MSGVCSVLNRGSERYFGYVFLIFGRNYGNCGRECLAEDRRMDLANNETIDWLYDHYKQTDELRIEAQNRRNKSFLLLCILEAVSFLVIVQPELVWFNVIESIHASLAASLIITNTILQSLLWVVIVYVLIRYVQDVLYIERQYRYQERLERKLFQQSGYEMNRESGNYSSDYPIVLNLIDIFYKMFCPVLFFVLNLIRIVQEWRGQVGLALLLDTCVCAASLLIIWFYFFEIHRRISEWCKKRIPVVNRISLWLRNILKKI